MRIREEQNLNIIFFEHFVRIELEYFLPMRVHDSNIFMIPGDGVKTPQISWCNQPLPRKKTATNRVSEMKARKKHSRIEISENWASKLTFHSTFEHLSHHYMFCGCSFLRIPESQSFLACAPHDLSDLWLTRSCFRARHVHPKYYWIDEQPEIVAPKCVMTQKFSLEKHSSILRWLR